MRQQAAALVANRWFERIIVGLILLNSLLLGLETFDNIRQQYGASIELAYDIILAVFVLEMLLKMVALAPNVHHYFKDGWNIFDFTIVVLSLLPATGSTAMIARMVRIFRVLRLISVLPELRVLVSTLLRSIPGIGNIGILLALIFYVYGVAGYQFFHKIDPDNWGDLWTSLLTLFQIITLEGWTDLMDTVMPKFEWAWLYFTSFVVVATFMVMNLIIAVVLDNLEGAKEEAADELPANSNSKDQLIAELQADMKAMQDKLERLSRK